MATWSFWNDSKLRPKFDWQALVEFSDILFGGPPGSQFPSFLATRFNRPEITLATSDSKYQLKSGHTALVNYPSNDFDVGTFNVTLVDVDMGTPEGPDTSAHIYNILTIMGRTHTFESDAMISPEYKRNDNVNKYMEAYLKGSPTVINVHELNNGRDINGSRIAGTWSFHQPLLTKVDWSGFNYSGFGASTATVGLSFRYKHFSYQKAGPNSWQYTDLEEKVNAAVGSLGFPYAATSARNCGW